MSKKCTKAELERENDELRKKVALLEDTVRRLLTLPQVPQLIPIPVPCPCPPTDAPSPWTVPYQPYEPPVWPTPIVPMNPQPLFPAPLNPRWPLVPEVICGQGTCATTICSVN